MAAISHAFSYQMHFLKWRSPYFDVKFTEVCHLGPTKNWSALVQVIALFPPGDKPLPELIMKQFTEAYMPL